MAIHLWGATDAIDTTTEALPDPAAPTIQGRVVHKNSDRIGMSFLQSPENLALVDDVLASLPRTKPAADLRAA